MRDGACVERAWEPDELLVALETGPLEALVLLGHEAHAEKEQLVVSIEQFLQSRRASGGVAVDVDPDDVEPARTEVLLELRLVDLGVSAREERHAP